MRTNVEGERERAVLAAERLGKWGAWVCGLALVGVLLLMASTILDVGLRVWPEGIVRGWEHLPSESVRRASRHLEAGRGARAVVVLAIPMVAQGLALWHMKRVFDLVGKGQWASRKLGRQVAALGSLNLLAWLVPWGGSVMMGLFLLVLGAVLRRLAQAHEEQALTI